MRKLAFTIILLFVASCGYQQRDGETIGQAKKVSHVTPLICDDYYAFEVSMGVMQNGTGSISQQDEWFTVTREQDLKTLQMAVGSHAIVKVHYDVRRIAFCVFDHWMTSVEIVQ